MIVCRLVGFNGISTSIGYFRPKPVYTYVRFVNTWFNDTMLEPNNSFTRIRVNIFKYFYMIFVYLEMMFFFLLLFLTTISTNTHNGISIQQ